MEGRPVDVSLRKGVHFVKSYCCWMYGRFMKQNVCKFKPRRFNTEMTFGGREIFVGCQTSGSFKFYPCRGYGCFLE